MLCWSVMSDVVLKAAHTLIVAFQAAKDSYSMQHFPLKSKMDSLVRVSEITYWRDSNTDTKIMFKRKAHVDQVCATISLHHICPGESMHDVRASILAALVAYRTAARQWRETCDER